jgi:hypothetical protein
MKNKIKSSVIVFILFGIISCSKNVNTQERQEESPDTSNQKESISAQNSAKTEKWKKEIYKNYPSKRLPTSEFE